MSTASEINTAPQRDWRLNSLRFTFFSDTPLTVAGSALFDGFFGLSADAETHRKAEFLSEFTAEKGQVVYQTIIAGPKVDFLASIGLSPEVVQSGFPVLPQEGNFEARFSEAAKNLVAEERTHITRVAVGAHFVHLVSDKEEGYQSIARLIPGIRLDPSCSDFQYRINRPRFVSCAGQEMHINRLSTWGCLSMQIGVGVSGGVSSHSTIGSAVSVVTDINSVPSQNLSKFANDVRASVIENIFKLSREIAQNGDVS